MTLPRFWSKTWSQTFSLAFALFRFSWFMNDGQARSYVLRQTVAKSLARNLSRLAFVRQKYLVENSVYTLLAKLVLNATVSVRGPVSSGVVTFLIDFQGAKTMVVVTMMMICLFWFRSWPWYIQLLSTIDTRTHAWWSTLYADHHGVEGVFCSSLSGHWCWWSGLRSVRVQPRRGE